MAAIRKVARVVPGASEVIAAVCELDYGKPGKPEIDWDDPAAKEALVSDLVNDALAVLAGLTGDGTPERERLRRTLWGCWRWSPGRTWNPQGILMALMAGGRSPVRWPRIG